MSFCDVWRQLKLDLERYTFRLKQPAVGIVLLFPGFQALAFYRIRKGLNTRAKRRNVLWWPVIIIELILARIIEIVTGIYIDVDAEIGTGLFMPHFGGIVIGEHVTIGRNCNIYQGVTLGFGGRDPQSGFPKVGDRALIGAGAKLIGPLTIGDDVAVGANAVVSRSFPDRAVVIGIPARAISNQGSFDYIHYPGEQQDADRVRSLGLRDAPASNLHQNISALLMSTDNQQLLEEQMA